MKTKIFYGNQYVGKFNCNGDVSLKTKIMTSLKKWTKRVAWSMVFAWCLVGMFKLGQHLYPVTVFADREVQVPVEPSIPILDKIIKCESGGRQFDANGQVLIHVNADKTVDIGVMQINETYQGKLATKMGYDLTKESDNRAFGKYLFLNQGSTPWESSSYCWSK